MIDFFVSKGCLVSRVLVHFQISDHCVISGSVAFSTNQAEPRRQVFDFRRTWDLRKLKLEQFFDNVDICNLFLNHKVDEIPLIVNNLISKAWNKFGIVKFVNSSSKPWLSKAIKSKRRRSRFWERKRNKAKRDLGFVIVDGIVYSSLECEALRSRELRAYFADVTQAMSDCDSYTDRLLDSNIYGTVKRLYRGGKPCIPTF